MYGAAIRMGAMPRRCHLSLLLLGCLTGAGCVQRMIKITSDPPGALVRLNDEEVGRTPVTVPFTFYGVYDVRLHREPLWMAMEAAAAARQVEVEELREAVETGRLDSRQSKAGIEVPVHFQPLWTTHRAKAPWWETPGVDLLAEAIPTAKATQHWHFDLTPQLSPGEHDSKLLIDHARQLRATTVED